MSLTDGALLVVELSVRRVDWPLARTLLHVWVEISLSESLRIAFEKLKAVRIRLGEDSQEEEVLRAQFLKTYGASVWGFENLLLHAWGQETTNVEHVFGKVLRLVSHRHTNVIATWSS